MSTYFIDLDGTIFNHGTNDFLPGSREYIEELKEDGHMIVFTTRRGQEFEGHPVYDKKKTLEALKRLNIKYDSIIFDSPSPRIVINDSGCSSINCISNEGLEEERINIKKEKKIAEDIINDIFGYPAFFLYKANMSGNYRWYRANNRKEAAKSFIDGESIKFMDEDEQEEYEKSL